MKKLNLLLAFTLSVLIFGCQKEQNIKPAVDNNHTAQAPAQRNGRTVVIAEWDKLPAELKNARRETVTNPDLGRINAVYKYSIGPWGGLGGTPFSIYPLGANDRIYAIGGRGTSYVEGFVVWYITPTGTIYYYAVGNTSLVTAYVFNSNPREYVYKISGYTNGTLINKLTIHTYAGTFFDDFTFGNTNLEDNFSGTVPFEEQILGFFGGATTGALIRIGGYVYTL